MPDFEEFDGFITRNALKVGILERRLRLTNATGLVTIVGDEEHKIYTYRDWYRYRHTAVQRAEEMRAREIKRLEERLEKVRNLRFE